jgi:hypothetical protein
LTKSIGFLSKTLQSDTYRSRDFDIILECTFFTSKSEVPLQWLKYCTEIIPADIRLRFSTTRILNPNTLAQKYLRRLYNVSAGRSIYLYIPFLSLMTTRNSTLQRNKGLYFGTPVTRGCEIRGAPFVSLCRYNLSFDNDPFLSLLKISSLIGAGHSRNLY